MTESVSGMRCLLADFVWRGKVELNRDLAVGRSNDSFVKKVQKASIERFRI